MTAMPPQPPPPPPTPPTPPAPHDRLMDLLAARATQGLTQAETRELEALLAAQPGTDPDAMDLAAAALDIAMSGAPGAAPAALVARLKSESPPASLRSPFETSPIAGRTSPAVPRAPSRARVMALAGWIAAAACLAIAAFIALRPQPDAAARRQTLLAADGTVTHPWRDFTFPPAPSPDKPEPPEIRGVTGDVVWNEARQTGFARFVGLPVNNPAAEQYQLWVMDERGLAFRISGGVFDSTSTGETIIAFTPAIPTRHAAIFGVTIEPRGGVIVSDLKRRVVIAPLP
jgi:hypothetical protein